MTKCGNADKFKGRRPPRCNGGKACDVCNAKWQETRRLISKDSVRIYTEQGGKYLV